MASTPENTDSASKPPAGLTREEDDQLRRLAYLAKLGDISDEMKVIMVDLLSRDRRKTVRVPRDGISAEHAGSREQCSHV